MKPLFEPELKNGLTRDLMQALFSVFEEASAGAIAVDREARITWLNSRYAELLGIPSIEAALGQPIRSVIPQTRMPEVIETGSPLLLDIMEYRNQQLVVMRLPMIDEEGEIAGAVAFVLYDDLQPLTPLVTKYRGLHQDLLAARKALAEQVRGTRYSLGDFIGASPGALEVKRLARLAAGREMPVLVLGETGTGKEVLAQSIHRASSRLSRPFVGVNVAAVPENLLEAEFFGTAPGAFTGADKRSRDGKFQLANGGTLFLDEVGDMPLALQAKLLRVLQEGEVEPLGSNKVHKVDVRVIAATSRNLEAMIESGDFRSDLYYRLNVLEIAIPPLRNRRQDIGILCESLLESICRETGARCELDVSALNALSAHDWPGNIRELRNVLERALMMVEEPGTLNADDINRVLPRRAGLPQTQEYSQVRALSDVLADAEAEAINAALASTQGNRSSAARLLGISRSSLYEKLARMSGNQDTCP